MHVKREQLCVSVCVSRNLKPSDKKSGLHIEVPSVYMADVQSVSVYIDSRQREYGDKIQNPVFLREELFLQICVFN